MKSQQGRANVPENPFTPGWLCEVSGGRLATHHAGKTITAACHHPSLLSGHGTDDLELLSGLTT